MVAPLTLNSLTCPPSLWDCLVLKADSLSAILATLLLAILIYTYPLFNEVTVLVWHSDAQAFVEVLSISTCQTLLGQVRVLPALGLTGLGSMVRKRGGLTLQLGS